jgi:hypothetical protein
MVRTFTQPEPSRNEEPLDNGYHPVSTYLDLRNMVFGTDPAQLGSRKPDTRDRTWGLVIETGYPDAVATMIILADGTVSLYFSSGGGLVGLGDHDHISEAGHRLLSLTTDFVSCFEESREFPLPDKGQIRIYLMAYSGISAAEGSAARPWRDPMLMPLIDRVQELFAMIRTLADQLAEQREGKAPAQPARIH